MQVTGEQIRAARALLRWEQTTLADHAKTPLATVQRVEDEPGPAVGDRLTINAIRGALEAAGVEFLNDGQPGVRMKSAPPAVSDEAALPKIPETDDGPYDGAPI